MLIRRETPADVDAIRSVTAAAFAPSPVEAPLVDELRACAGWLPPLSLVAVGSSDAVIGHVLCTRAHIGFVPVLGLGPLSVHPDHHTRGVGSALVHTVLGAADALSEPLVALLGNPAYYHRFGFVLSDVHGILPPDPAWQSHFQVRTLTAYTPTLTGTFAYAEPFSRHDAS